MEKEYNPKAARGVFSASMISLDRISGYSPLLTNQEKRVAKVYTTVRKLVKRRIFSLQLFKLLLTTLGY